MMKTKNLLLNTVIILILISCQKVENLDFNFSVTGIDNYQAKIGETMTIPLDIQCTNGAAENVLLSLTDVPKGVEYVFETEQGIPNFKTTLVIFVSNQARLGNYLLTLQAKTSTNAKTEKFALNIDDKLSMVMTVYDANQWNSETGVSVLVDSASVKLYENIESFYANTPFYSTLTDETGKAYFYSIPYGNYIYIVEKGEMSNIVQRINYEGDLKGFIAVDIFHSKQEIFSSCQPLAKIGDIRFRDLNLDGKITDEDRRAYDELGIYGDNAANKIICLGNK